MGNSTTKGVYVKCDISKRIEYPPDVEVFFTFEECIRDLFDDNDFYDWDWDKLPRVKAIPENMNIKDYLETEYTEGRSDKYIKSIFEETGDLTFYYDQNVVCYSFHKNSN